MEGRQAHLVLSAGGVRCISYVGALEQLAADGYEYKSISACSAGTLIGALLGSGVSPAAMREAILETDLKSLAGTSRFGRLGHLWRLRAWPFARYSETGIPQFYDRLVEGSRMLGDLDPPLAAAAVDIEADRLLVYSSESNPDMPVTELLRITTAVPLMYRPHHRDQREIIDAALGWQSPLTLALAASDDLPVIVLRTHRSDPSSQRQSAASWFADAMASSVAGRDMLLIESTPRVTVHDIAVEVDSFSFDLGKDQIEQLIDQGQFARSVYSERLREGLSSTPGPSSTQEDRAEANARAVHERHAASALPTLFICYASADREIVDRARWKLRPLIADPAISVWDDSYIAAGADWDGAIRQAIARARVALLFVSERSNKSEYIASTELKLLEARAAKGQLQLLWVSVDGSLPLTAADDYQAALSPRPPLVEMDEPELDRSLAELARLVERTFSMTGASSLTPELGGGAKPTPSVGS